ncbi:hypothetical protein QEN19_001475 [Hanseniaspora menglaensis]
MVETTKRVVRIKTKQSIIEEEPLVEGFPVHRWSIEVALLDAEGNEMPANIFDRVVYHLHPTFVNPNRTFKKQPFRIEEKGWGGFEMSISLFLAEKGGERKVKHDLHFMEFEYNIEHTITVPLSKPKLNILLQDSGPIPNTAATTSNNTELEQQAASTTPLDASADADLIATPSKRVRTQPEDVSSQAKNKKQKTSVQIAQKGSVDLEKLAQGLTKLNEEQIIAIVQMITDNSTPEMNVKNNAEDGEFIFDMFSLPEGLLKSMSEYVQAHTAVSE